MLADSSSVFKIVLNPETIYSKAAISARLWSPEVNAPEMLSACATKDASLQGLFAPLASGQFGNNV